MTVPDALFADPRLARVYDAVDGRRDDLDPYLAIVDELGARSVLDIGCGTGTFACLLAHRGLEVTAVDPAAASLDVARGKPGADRVRWVLGAATALPPTAADLAVMTANVAQVFLTDAEWVAVLRSAHAALRPDGWLVFETRDPGREAWREWTRERTARRLVLEDGNTVDTWIEVADVTLPLVSFRTTFVFTPGGEVLTSDSTLRFRSREAVEASLAAASFTVAGVRDAPDRPGRELVFIAQATGR